MVAECCYYLNMQSAISEQPPRTDAEIFSAGIKVLRERLPANWDISLPQSLATGTDFVLTGPDGTAVQIQALLARSVTPRDISQLQEQAKTGKNSAREPNLFVMAPYLSSTVRERLVESGFSYADATGNIKFAATSPPMFISDRGSERDPWRGPGRPRATLRGEPAAKVVRALLDMPGPWKITDLVRASQSSTGSVYRVVNFLDSEALTTRTTNNRVFVPDWRKLLRRWSDDYQFLNANRVSNWIAPRGIEALLRSIPRSGTSDYVITGSAAASTWVLYAPTRSLMLYSDRPEEIAEAWGLRQTDAGANVVIAQPRYPVLVDRSMVTADGVRIAAPTQVAVDLLTGPGRAPAEGEELMKWMGENEDAWR